MWGAAPRNRRILLLLGVLAALIFGCVRSADSAVAPINWAANPSADFDGDHETDLGALYRGRSPQDSLWYAPSSSGGGPFQIYFGATTDIPVPGDYDGDGKTDAVIYRPSTGLWYGPRTGAAQIVIQIILGQAGDIPIPGDYNGDGKTDAAIYRPSTGLFFAVFSGGGGTKAAIFGDSDDLPVPADYNGDGKTDFAIYRPNVQGSNGALWHAELSGGGTYDAYWGGQNDIPVPADYNGDRRADPVTWRPSNGLWSGPFNGATGALQYTLGQSGDVPIPGYYDNDGAADPTIFRPSTGLWFAAYSGSGSQTISALGVSTDAAAQKRPGPGSAPNDKKAPTIPTNFTATSTTTTSVTTGWSPSSDNRGVTSYRTYRNGSTVANGMFTSYTFTGLTCGTSYTFGVDAADAAGNRSGTAQLTASTSPCSSSDTTPPSPVSGLHVTNTTQTSISYAWNAATDNIGVAGYNMFKGGSKIDSTTGLSYTYTGLTCGTQYTFAVQTYDAAGNTSDIAYATAINSTSACGTTDTAAPSTPTNLAATAATSSSISVSWTASTDNVGVAGYGRYQNGALLSSGTGTTYTFTGLNCATGYTLAVDAYDAAGNRSGTMQITASTSACSSGDTQAPTTPTNLAATGASSNSISVSWTASTDNVGVAGYGRYQNGALMSSGAGTTFTFNGLNCGTGYTLAVDAYDTAGNRSGKAQITASTSGCPTGGASVYMSTTGSDTNPCTQAQPCKTFDRAYKAATPGQVVEVAGGSYPGQTINPDSSKTSTNDIIFRPASGASVNVTGEIEANGAHFELRDMTIDQINFPRSADDITLRNVVNHGMWMQGPSNISIIGGEITCAGGSCDFHSHIQNGGDGHPPTNILWDGVYFHDWTSQAGEHVECLQILGGDNVTIRNSIFKNCGTGNGGLGATADLHIAWVATGTAMTKNILLEDNFFYPSGNPYVIQMDDYANIDLRNNSISGPIIIWDRSGPGTGIDIIGNILKASTCTAESSGVAINWRFNVIQGGTCGSTDKNAAPGFIDANNNLHLTAGSAAINAGDSTNFPAKDIDGQARPMGSAPDAGADEAG